MATRIIHTHDTEENWNKLTQFIPKKGEIIVFDADSGYNYERIKIGDGVTTIVNLPFTSDRAIKTFFEYDGNVCYADGGRISDYQ